MGQPVLSLIQIYLKWSKYRKKQLVMKIEKRLEFFVENCMKYLKGLHDLKRIVSGYEIIKSFEKCNAVWTRFTFDIFLKGQYGSNHIVLSLHPGFQKSGKCQILKDVMVQLQTIWLTVFKWIIRFNRTIQVGTLQFSCIMVRLSDGMFLFPSASD